MSANDTQCDGNHYLSVTYQTWDFITNNKRPYIDGLAVRYVSRNRKKNGVNDLKKAIHCIEKMIELFKNGIVNPDNDGTCFDVTEFGKANDLTCNEAEAIELIMNYVDEDDLRKAIRIISDMINNAKVVR